MDDLLKSDVDEEAQSQSEIYTFAKMNGEW